MTDLDTREVQSAWKGVCAIPARGALQTDPALAAPRSYVLSGASQRQPETADGEEKKVSRFDFIGGRDRDS